MASLRSETLTLIAGDAVLLVFSLWVALFLRNGAIPSSGYFGEHLFPFIPIFLLSLVVFYIAGLYEKQTRLVKSIMGMRIVGAQVANAIIAIILFFLLPLTIAPKTILFLHLLSSVAAVSAWRLYVAPHIILTKKRPALLVGTGSAAREVFEEVNGNNRYSLRFISRVDVSLGDTASTASRLSSSLGSGAETLVLDDRDPEVQKAVAMLPHELLARVEVITLSALYESLFDRVSLDHIDEAWLARDFRAKRPVYAGTKRLFDILFSLPAFLIALPIIVIASTFLFMEGGSALIFHDRVGKDGRPFRIVKLRTMLLNDHGDPELQKKNRVTGLGKFLRKTRIDELPQLWNILVGELSFVGPRPELPAIAAVYERELPHYRLRYLVPPGLSGWAQIYHYDAPRGPADIERTKRKLSYDLYYLKHRSFMLDSAIVLKTLRALVSFSGT